MSIKSKILVLVMLFIGLSNSFAAPSSDGSGSHDRDEDRGDYNDPPLVVPAVMQSDNYVILNSLATTSSAYPAILLAED